MPKTAPIPLPNSFDQLGGQAVDSVRRDARRLREVADRYREQYRNRLQDWVALRARVDLAPTIEITDQMIEENLKSIRAVFAKFLKFGDGLCRGVNPRRDFMRECKAAGANVILVTKEKMLHEDWPRENVSARPFVRDFFVDVAQRLL